MGGLTKKKQKKKGYKKKNFESHAQEQLPTML